MHRVTPHTRFAGRVAATLKKLWRRFGFGAQHALIWHRKETTEPLGAGAPRLTPNPRHPHNLGT
eukprot:scaffold15540_cov31-Tisochrysis_lutea.AAC.5